MIKLEVLTPKGLEFQGEADVLILPTQTGQISVLPRHAPLISVLQAGRMKIKTNQEEITREIEGGILEIFENQAVILLKRF